MADQKDSGPRRLGTPPWLAERGQGSDISFEPAFRGRGHAKALVHRVESFASGAAVSVLWLYTLGAEAFYTRLGWVKAGLEEDRGQPVVLMKRVLNQPGKNGSPFHDP